MKHLKRITISNARRFGKDVEIDFGTGANIILAPNGTGKTTLFEAIEFALTGSIQRLGNPPLSLIRDRQEGVDVRLDFDDDIFCEVNFRKGGDPILTGNHNLVYPNRKATEIPNLLRLTHLLEQRGTNWFVQQRNSSDAGQLLDKLSLGRDINVIFKTKTSALNAATRAIRSIEEELEATKYKASSFEEKLAEKKAAMNDYVLRPLTELISTIDVIYKTLNRTDNQQTDEKVDALLALAGQTEPLLSNAIEQNSLSQIKLSKVENKIETFIKNKNNLRLKDELIIEKKRSLEKIHVELKELTDDNLQKEKQINEDKDKLASLEELKKIFTDQQIESINNSKIGNEFAEQSELLIVKKNTLLKTVNSFEGINNLISKHNIIRARESELLSKQGELLSLKPLISDWLNHEALITNIEIVILPSLYQEQVNGENSVQNIQQELDVAEREFDFSKQKLNSLRNVSDAIQGAVAVISTNLPESQGNCPVCAATYEPLVLRDKINKALTEIDPILRSEIERNKKLQQKVTLTETELEKSKLNLIKIQNELTKYSENTRNSKRAINERYLPKFPNCRTFEEADEWLGNEEDKVNLDLLKISDERKALPPEPKSEQVDEILLNRDIAVREVEALERSIQSLLSKLNSSSEKLIFFKQRLSGATIEGVNDDISKTVKMINDVTQELLDKRRIQENLERKLEEISKQILVEEGFVSQIIGQQNGILSEWRDMKLEGEPSSDKFTEKQASLVMEEKALARSKDDLNKINGELGRWKIAERYEKISNEIKDICGNLNENDYLEKLKLEIKEIEGRHNMISERKQALDKLYNNIGNEVDNVHQQIVTINPLWISLLKKVVINPRFVETTLNSYPYRNQPHATVEVALHNTRVNVMQVASEAQATDLQLTFMLSMASSYQWTPWRALLLDDPTQHHDLVHAAGVFDLLRDFIVDQDFQILLGTHDSVQARFFQRKLQNDGVPVKLWNLIADSNGVKAESI